MLHCHIAAYEVAVGPQLHINSRCGHGYRRVPMLLPEKGSWRLFNVSLTMYWILFALSDPFIRTDSIINTLIIYTINTGLLTAVCALCCVITVSVRVPHHPSRRISNISHFITSMQQCLTTSSI